MLRLRAEQRVGPRRRPHRAAAVDVDAVRGQRAVERGLQRVERRLAARHALAVERQRQRRVAVRAGLPLRGELRGAERAGAQGAAAQRAAACAPRASGR